MTLQQRKQQADEFKKALSAHNVDEQPPFPLEHEDLLELNALNDRYTYEGNIYWKLLSKLDEISPTDPAEDSNHDPTSSP